ncbi:MAG: hypothetical protein JNK10_07700 [Cyclobacteriaceae bacterium]|nr:hypothetical protein [Cyclobacteriaceae bacterium]
MEENEILPAVLGILLPIIITLGAFIMVVYLRKFENIERMSMIEKGVAPDLFKKDRVNGGGTLRWSFLLIGVGIGFLMGYWLDEMYNMQETGYFSMLFIFGGLGLGLSYFFEESRKKQS